MVRGIGFYRLGLDARIEHPDYRLLRPGGDVGHGYGFAGTLLIFTNLLYLVRRRLAAWSLGSMQTWLDLHVFTGLTGATLVTFHSAFQLRSSIATTTAVSLGVVVVTGIIGRFIYALSPRPDEQRLVGAMVEIESLLPGAAAQVQAAIDQIPAPALSATASLWQCLRALPAWRSSAAQRRDVVRIVVGNQRGLGALGPAERARALHAATEAGAACSAEIRAGAASAFLRSWRSLHRFFALLMLLTVGVHIGVAWHYGYRWIF